MKYRNLLKRMAALSLSGMMLLSAVPVQAEEGEQPVAETAADVQTADEGIPEADVPTEELVTEDVENTAAQAGIPLDEAHFPDPTLREYVKRVTGGDEILTPQESQWISFLNFSDSNITTLQGIEYLPELTTLMCMNNQITSLDLSKNPKLKELYVSDNNLTKLDLSKNPELESVFCANNQLTELDLSNNPKLVEAVCFGNKLTSLNLNGCTEVELVSCSNNELTSLDLRNHKKVKTIYAQACKLENLYISDSGTLEYIGCDQNKLTSLDLSGNPSLTKVVWGDNPLTSVDLSGCTELAEIIGYNHQLSSLDLSDNKKLTFIDVSTGKLTDLDLSNHPALTEAYLYDNELVSVDVDGCPELECLNVSRNNLKEVDMSKNQKLQRFFCEDNGLTSLDLSNNPELRQMKCNGNQLPYLNMDKNQKLEAMDSGNQSISVEARQKDGKWTIDLSEYIPEKELSRVGVPDEGCTYDASAGVITLRDNSLKNITYNYLSLDKELPEDGQYTWVEATVTYDENGGEEEQEKLPFEDVREGDWFYDNVAYVYDNKLMTGLKETIFGPSDSLARAQFAVILHRMEGTPAAEGSAEFPDVEAGIWYDEAVSWASEAGVVSGYSDGRFGPNDNINREQMAVMMYRYAKYKGFDVSETADFSKFADASSVNEFAKEAMQWAVGTGIISGKENGTRIDPQGNAVRAECATIIQRFRTYYGL